MSGAGQEVVQDPVDPIAEMVKQFACHVGTFAAVGRFVVALDQVGQIAIIETCSERLEPHHRPVRLFDLPSSYSR